MKADEEHVFQSIRKALEGRGWRMLAGQAARGSTDLPVVQARIGTMRGSKGALKPDLVASIGGYVLVLELKPAFSILDVHKCQKLAQSPQLISSLLADLAARRKWVLDARGQPSNPRLFLTGVAYQGEPRQLDKTVCFALSISENKWTVMPPALATLPAELIKLLVI